MRSNPASTDLTELIKEKSFKDDEVCISFTKGVFSILHYYCCYVPCSIIYKD